MNPHSIFSANSSVYLTLFPGSLANWASPFLIVNITFFDTDLIFCFFAFGGYSVFNFGFFTFGFFFFILACLLCFFFLVPAPVFFCMELVIVSDYSPSRFLRLTNLGSSNIFSKETLLFF